MNKPVSCFKCPFLGDCSSEADKCGIDKHKFEPYLAKAVTRDKNCPLDMNFNTLTQRFCSDCGWAECPYPEDKCDEFAVLYFTMCNSMVEELEKIKKELQEHINVFGTEFGCELTQVQQMNNCAVQRDIDVINEHISKLKGE